MTTDPRWSTHDRAGKADAILRTMKMVCGNHITSGYWLDVGCGSGDIARRLASQVQNIDGVDPEAWERWATFEQEAPNLRFHVGACDQDEPPLKIDRYDVIICNQVYEHVHDPRALLFNINRMLKINGNCYFAGPNLWWPIEPHVSWPFVHWLPRTAAHRWMRALGSKRAKELDAFSASYFQLTSWFRNAGFIYRNIFPERLRAGLREGSPLEVAVQLFAGATNAITPLHPGFVFHLRHPK